jgi:hypothetical protein
MLLCTALGCSDPFQEDPILQSIAITTPPTKTSYTTGENLDLTGLVVTGTYSDGTSKTETGILVSGYNPNTLGQQAFTVTVNGKTAAFSVTVNNSALVSIQVSAPPNKRVYAKDEALDLTGLVVTGTYSDGTSKTETGILVSGYNPNTLGQQTFTVTVNGKTAAFSVTVKANAANLMMNLEDPISGIPQDILLSRTGEPNTLDLSIDGTYAGYEWYLNAGDTPVSTSPGYTLRAADCTLGRNFLTMQVKTGGGVYYAKEITFRVMP